ncbi:uncharacterized protein LOC120027542 isoform X1 [Salvelinus namaycush]|uniref:Uncharacterized protein LOC120027542 isoform X1 n=1 Tax=Salvelinus namaycush TaxID=8040 RepID=A0A8U0TTB3_SALNM|nr:uncharacterized protein LOC120027542 isoform X1 [Salvelinus namaycush]
MYTFMLIVLYFSTECIVQSQSEIYSLNYIYTALSKPVELPGIHEFTAMGLLNDKQIDYYDSVDKKKIPKQDWMREKLPADYWEKGTQSRKSKEQWFKVNINILMDRMGHNNTDVHVLQWKHGCEIDKQPDGTLKFIKGTDQYSYDGDDFLAFDFATMQWVAPVDQALPTKRKWDGVQILNQYTKGYLEKECVDWLSKFMEYGDKELSSTDPPPNISVFAKKATPAGNVRLTCMATGFYPKDVIIHIKKNGVQLTEDDGVQSDGVLPNNDDTYQIRISVQIPEADKEMYECSVSHTTLNESIVKKWGAGKSGALPPPGIQTPLNGNGNGATNSNMTTTPMTMDGASGISSDSGKYEDGSSNSSDSGQGSQKEKSSDGASEEEVKTPMLPNGKIYSLNYIYTALSKPVELPGIHEFTAMGLLNDKQIDYYDSVDKKKIPKQDWMREKLPADYWEKGTQSRKSKEQWFKVNINILMDRMGHNNTDVHVLQWKHGCEIDKQPDGTLKFIKGTDQYSYDGDDFLAFDFATMQWVASVVQAVPTKRKWDGVQILNQYTKGYLEKECVDWLSKFMEYGDKELSSTDPPPNISVFAKKATPAGNVRLTCMATGFYPKDVIIHIKKNGVQLTEDDGVQSDGVLPNNDDTYQIRISVQIPEADKEMYECSVSHTTLNESIVKKWGAGNSGALPPPGIQTPLNGNGNGATNSNMTTTPMTMDGASGISSDSGKYEDGSSNSSDSGQGSQKEKSSDGASEEEVKTPMLPNGKIYSLNYIYTALSKPVELPGIHEFTAMGLLNDKQIDYYDSVDKKKIPKQDWMREKLPADYWEKGTQSRKSKEQWFKVNINILMDRMGHNNTDVHVLQWKHGCEIDKQPDGTLKFIKGTDQYSYDGDDFLAFDFATMQWVASVVQAVPTKRKWDGVQILNQYTKGYLEKECVDWLSKFMEYGDKELSSTDPPPNISVFAKKATPAGNVRLTCMATGFYPKDVIIHIKKNGVQLTEDDGVQSDGVLPNNDDTYQIRISVQIPEADKEMYECSVSHTTLNESIVKKWGAGNSGALPPPGIQTPLNGNGNGATNSNMTTTPSKYEDGSSNSSDSGHGSQKARSSDGASEEEVKMPMLLNGSG